MWYRVNFLPQNKAEQTDEGQKTILYKQKELKLASASSAPLIQLVHKQKYVAGQ